MTGNDEEKLKFILNKLLERHAILLWAVKRLIEKKGDEPKGKAYYPVPSLVLCFCFLDFLRRFNYIWENGKDGGENENHRKNYTQFLDKFIINNDEYNKKEFSLTTDELYSTRNDLVHSFSLQELYRGKYISFVDGTYFDTKEKINNCREIISRAMNIAHQNIKLIKIHEFLEIIKSGIKKMFGEYEKQLKESENNQVKFSQLKTRLDELYEELKNATCEYEELDRDASFGKTENRLISP